MDNVKTLEEKKKGGGEKKRRVMKRGIERERGNGKGKMVGYRRGS